MYDCDRKITFTSLCKHEYKRMNFCWFIENIIINRAKLYHADINSFVFYKFGSIQFIYTIINIITGSSIHTMDTFTSYLRNRDEQKERPNKIDW